MQVDEETHIHGRHMTYYTDSGKYYSRMVFTHRPCDSIQVLDTSGNLMEKRRAGIYSNCYNCSEMESSTGIFDRVKFREKDFSYWIVFPDANLSVHSEMCSKYVHDFLDKWPDSMSVVIWHKTDTVKGTLIFYLAEESYTYPYYKTGRMDSLIYDLKEFCTQKDIDDTKKQWHEALDPQMKVLITPNPFKDEFELLLTFKASTPFLQREPIRLTFFDDMGNKFETRIIETNKKYTFSFPDILPGKTIYYNVTWSEYKVAGQILKAN
jgi:hypothetical protein